MKQYNVTGMSCAACSARVEKAVSALPGVVSCSVNLLTGSMLVEGDISDREIIRAVTAAGYGAEPKNSGKIENIFTDREMPRIRKRLFLSLFFLIILMYFTMGHMAGLPQPEIFHRMPITLGIAELILTSAIMVINGKFFVSGTKALFRFSPNMDTLVSLGAAAAFIYSTALLIISAGESDPAKVSENMHGLFFESAAMILTLITVGKLLEAYSKGKTTNALKALYDLSPKTATVIIGDGEKEIPADEVKIGDIIAVRPGGIIPVDGKIIYGETSVDESALTGESMPADKAPGDRICAGTANLSGYIRCEAVGVGGDTALAGIINAVSDAAAAKAPVQKIADRVSGIFVPVVMGIALITAAVWLMIDGDLPHALSRGISVLVISCPCSLGLATPVAIMVGNGVGAKHGILFKTAEALEEAGKAGIAVLDKTGTVTNGDCSVTDIITDGDETEFIRRAAALEKNSEHPLSAAVCAYAASLKTDIPEVESFSAHPGHGVCAVLDGKVLSAGNAGFIKNIPEKLAKQGKSLSLEGKTPLYFAENGICTGIIAVSDTVKEDSPKAVSDLSLMGIRTVMLTGDNEITAKAVAAEVGISEVIAGVLPDGKDAVIRKLQKSGKVLMVGDGINDAPALTRADTGIAIGAGVDIAIDSADVVLMSSRPSDIAAAVRLSRRTLRNIKENLFWAFFYNALGIPLAAGVFTPLLGWEISPMFAAAAMSLSSFSVVMNALRLNFTDIYTGNGGKPKHKQKKKKEKKTMEKTIKIEGMMCHHCEKHVKDALEKLDGVESAAADHEAGEAVVTLSAYVSDSVLTAAVENEGYTVISVI